jgi:predicted dehydrogenase
MTIGVGLMGTGFIGQTHAQACGVLTNAQLVAVADVNREAADSVVQETGTQRR